MMTILLTKREVAERLRRHPTSVMRLVRDGKIAPPVRFSPNGPVLFDEAAIERTLEELRNAASFQPARNAELRQSEEPPAAEPTAPDAAESQTGKKKRKRQPPAKGGAPAPRAG